MDTFLNTLHSYNRYLVLAAMVFVLIRSYNGWLNRKPFEKADNTASVALLGLAHLQALIGLIMYAFTSTWTQTAFANFGAAMKDPMQRYFAVEHISAMLIAVALIQVGRTLSKKASDDVSKHRKLAIYTSIALVIIVGTLAQKGLLFGSLS
ncbi:MAG: hypothetical protein H6574_21310 [Lewinellaceae bacterium]|nr:hypothetical protein [Saprospiraceae bacterium]MCB9333603.1 hypothetical protein [Lewinellaceae bacterium]